MDTLRNDLYAHPEKYVLRAHDYINQKMVERDAVTINRDILLMIDLQLVYPK